MAQVSLDSIKSENIKKFVREATDFEKKLAVTIQQLEKELPSWTNEKYGEGRVNSFIKLIELAKKTHQTVQKILTETINNGYTKDHIILVFRRGIGGIKRDLEALNTVEKVIRAPLASNDPKNLTNLKVVLDQVTEILGKAETYDFDK